ncbi:MAG TPA: hypothetical protein VFK68_08180 [Propionibacteriaceae bacterium]|nr:hypothetical protein [Propionibacteriaceae bacterium]
MAEVPSPRAEVDDYFALLAQAESLPAGARVPVLEEAVRTADALGYEDLGGQSRLRLVQAYEWSNSGPKIFTPFTWLLQRYEQRRSWFDEELRFQFLWQLKWITGHLFSYPEVPLARIEENLATMYRIYSEAGEGLGPVHGCAFQLARHVRGIWGAQREFEDWLASDRTHLSDCAACEPSTRARYRVQQGRWQDALDIALPALASGTTCQEEPSTLYATVVEPLLMTGRGDDALVAHRRGWRLAADDDTQVDQAATHILTLARAGAVDRGVEALARRIDLLEAGITPYEQMTLAAAGTRLLDAASGLYGMGSRTMSYQHRDVTFDELRHLLRGQALTLAQRFDARNGTPEVGRLVWERYINAPTLPPLPLPPPVVPPPPAAAHERHPLAPDLRELQGLTVERLSDLVELALRYSPLDDVRLLAREWQRRRHDLPALVEAAPAERLEAAASLEYLLVWSDPDITAEGAEPCVRSAATLYREAGQEAEALVVEQWLMARSERWDEALAMVPAIDATGSAAQRGRARVRVLHGVPEERRYELLAEVRALPCAVDSDHQLRRIWATAHGAGTDSPEELYTWTGQGLAMLLPGEYADSAAGLHVQRAFACRFLDRADESEAELGQAMRLARASGDVTQAAVLLAQGRLALGDEDTEGAEALLLQAAALSDRARATDTLADAKSLLAEMYRHKGRLLEAAEVAESGLAAVELARASGVFLDSSMTLKQARLSALSAEISADLEETGRATSLFERAAELYEKGGEESPASAAWGAYARLVQASDSVAAVRAYRRAIRLAQAADDQRALMVTRRQLPMAVQDADGLNAALRELDIAWTLTDDNEARFLTDTEFRERLGAWDFDFERLDLRDTRARLYGSAERYDEALLILGDVPERMAEQGAETQSLNSRLLRARLLFAATRVDDGIAQIEHIIGVVRTWDDGQSTVTDMAGIGARALMAAGREADADAFWEKHAH